MKKIVLSVLFVFIGFGYSNALTSEVSPELAAARAKYDTPFIKEYRKRYEAKYHLSLFHFATIECQKNCTEKDKANLRKLAEAGDMFSLIMLPSIVLPNESIRDLLKNGADKGEVISAGVYSGLFEKNNEKAIAYALMSAQKGYIGGYSSLLTLYDKTDDTAKFCSAAKDGYQKFGLELLSRYFINPNNTISQRFFSKCVKQQPLDILTKAGDEGKLIQGYMHVANSEYDEAYKLFNDIYKEGDGSQISANAGYCLGMMNYYGRGVKKNLDKGRKLLKESFDNGVIYGETPEQVSMPAKLEIMSYGASNCFTEIK